jgi:hypothetical protein
MTLRRSKMYYSAIVNPSVYNEKELVRAYCESQGIPMQFIREVGEDLEELITNNPQITATPVIFAGKKIIGWGQESLVNLFEHFQANPHVEYEGEEYGQEDSNRSRYTSKDWGIH